jgi:hypothetical protein
MLSTVASSFLLKVQTFRDCQQKFRKTFTICDFLLSLTLKFAFQHFSNLRQPFWTLFPSNLPSKAFNHLKNANQLGWSAQAALRESKKFDPFPSQLAFDFTQLAVRYTAQVVSEKQFSHKLLSPDYCLSHENVRSTFITYRKEGGKKASTAAAVRCSRSEAVFAVSI